MMYNDVHDVMYITHLYCILKTVFTKAFFYMFYVTLLNSSLTGKFYFHSSNSQKISFCSTGTKLLLSISLLMVLICTICQ